MYVHPRRHRRDADGGHVAATGFWCGAEGSIAYTLAAIKDWTFILGPGWVVGWGNGLILGYLMYRSGLVPRQMAMLGLVGGPLIIVSGTLVMFGVDNAGGTLQSVATIPEFIWELSLGIYCTVKGFRPSPILSGNNTPCLNKYKIYEDASWSSAGQEA